MRSAGIFAALALGVVAGKPRYRRIGVDDDQRRAALEQEASEVAGKADEIAEIAAIDQPIARHQTFQDAAVLKDKRQAFAAAVQHQAQAAKPRMRREKFGFGEVRQ